VVVKDRNRRTVLASQDLVLSLYELAGEQNEKDMRSTCLIFSTYYKG